MAWFLSNRTCLKVPILRLAAKCGPIGVDIGDDTLTVVQLKNNGKSKSKSKSKSKTSTGRVTCSTKHE